MENEAMHSPFSLNNGNSLINNKASYSTCNSQLNNNSNSNSSSISNNLVVNDGIANQQHAMMKSNNIINNTSDCNKLQLTANSNLNMFISAEANSRNVNGESVVKDDNIANYKPHLMDDSQKFNLNNKHISCQQQQRDTQHTNPYRMMNDVNGSSLPLNLCQVSFDRTVFKSVSYQQSIYLPPNSGSTIKFLRQQPP
jgi:hypothetical protein